MTHTLNPSVSTAAADQGTDTRPTPTTRGRLTPGALRLLGGALALTTAVFAVCLFLPWPSNARAYLGDDIAAIANSLALTLIVGAALAAGAYAPSRAWTLLGTVATIVLGGITATKALAMLTLPVVPDTAEDLVQTLTLGVFWIAAFGILLVGSWSGPARVLPLLTASWPATALVAAMLSDDLGTAAWQAFSAHLLLGLTLTALTLMLDAPRLSRGRGASR